MEILIGEWEDPQKKSKIENLDYYLSDPIIFSHALFFSQKYTLCLDYII